MTPTRLQVPPNCDLTLGMVCVDKSDPRSTTWHMTADERFANPTGIVQGGFLAAFCDSAMAAAAVHAAAGRRVLAANVELKISYLAPVPAGSGLRCRADIVTIGARVAFAEASVTDDEGKTVARASSTFLLTDRN